ncbi:hypothetical protein GCM10023196_036640 [Actinoallomurus vinaceus]|uniref:Uncharacterized protein n=1 Tax=Actinoallomurus vinaceus TaxID=1080074 RepID=A0ABP8UAY3_9ACTN
MTQKQARTLAAHTIVLTELTAGASMREACRRAKVSPQTITEHARTDDTFRRQLAATGWRPGSPVRDTSWHPMVLAAIANGATIREAERQAGIGIGMISNRRKADPQFSAAVAVARRAGEATRKARTAAKVAERRQVQGCGTPAAYERHLSKGEEPCPPCRRANSEVTRSRPSYKAYEKAAYQARKRLAATHKEELRTLTARERLRTDRSPHNARGRALSTLVRLHKREYRALFAEERKAVRADATPEDQPQNERAPPPRGRR